MKRRWAVLVLALPMLVYLLAIVNAERHLARGEVYAFGITGYDPRDPLRGHYLRYQLAYDWAEQPGSCDADAGGAQGQECCLCLMSSDGPVPKVSRATCEDARARCDRALLETSVPDLQRYYIPEARAEEAEQLLRDGRAGGSARILVSVTPDGEGQIVDLEIDGRSINELLGQD